MRDFLENFFDNHPLILVTILACGIVLLCIGLVGLIEENNNKWEQFKIEHKCKIVAKISGGVSTGISSDGKVVPIIESDKTSWLCDDGIVYTR